jgi:hypothetical protein
VIEISYLDLRDSKFIAACAKLMETRGFGIKTAYHISKACTLLDRELKTANESFDVLLKKYAEPVEENGQKIFRIPETKVIEWQEVYGAFCKEVFKIDRNKFRLNELEAADLTPAEIVALQPILDCEVDADASH